MPYEETIGEDAAVCPYCGHRNHPEVSDGELYDESTDEYLCGLCDQEFLVTVHIRHTWRCRPKEDR